MIYYWNEERSRDLGADKPRTLAPPVKEFRDANGLCWLHEKIYIVDTETGEAMKYKTNEEGEVLIDHLRRECFVEKIKLAMPLKLVFKE